MCAVRPSAGVRLPGCQASVDGVRLGRATAATGWPVRGQTLSHAPPRFQSHPRRSRAYAPPVCELMLDSCLTRTGMPKPKGRPRWCRMPYRKPITATAKSRCCGLAGWAGSLALPGAVRRGAGVRAPIGGNLRPGLPFDKSAECAPWGCGR